MSDRLPAIVSQLPRDLRTFLDRVRDVLRSNGDDRFVTAEELLSAGIAQKTTNGGLAPTDTGGLPYLPTPPAPTSVTATAAIQNIIVEWDPPSYNGHAYAEVWTNSTDSIGSAVQLGMSPGASYVDSVGPSSTRYYWVRFVNANNEAGPFNAVSGTSATTGSDLAYTMGLLSDVYGGTSEAPFFQLDAPTDINGVTIPAGTYMKSAYIYDGVITNAKIGNLAVDNAKIASVSASKLTAGSVAVDEYIQSSNFVSGTQGWKIDGSGNAEFSNAIVRGTVYATDGSFKGNLFGGAATTYASGTGFFSGLDATTYKWRVGSPTGARIQWTGTAIEVYNSSNQLTITSGGISSAYVSGLGDFATLDQITSANISTYIASAAIGTAYIADAAITQAKIGNAAVGSAQIADAAITNAKIANAAITTAKIGDAQVDTLQLAGQAVTIPVSAYSTNAISTSASYSVQELTLQTLTFVSSGAPIFVFALVEGYASGGFAEYGGAYHRIRIKRESTVLRTMSPIYVGTYDVEPYKQSTAAVVDTPGAGSVTYTVSLLTHRFYEPGQYMSDNPGALAGNARARLLFCLETKR